MPTTNEWDVTSLVHSNAVRIKYRGNVLYSSAHRTTRDNATAAMKALAILLDDPTFEHRIPVSIEEGTLVMKLYTSC